MQLSLISLALTRIYGGGVSDPDAVIKALFENGEQGAWYDPSDFSTMFQDSAGTTPVTAVGQTVGKILDKSGRGNHAFQATAASRPELSARVNLLTGTESLTNGTYWSAWGGATCTGGITDPNGGAGAFQIDMSSAYTGWHTVNTEVPLGVQSTAGIYIRADSAGSIRFFDGNGNSTFDTTISVTTSWQWASTTGIKTIGLMQFGVYRNDLSQLSKVYIAFPDYRISGGSSSIPTYQRVNTATDYDSEGFPHYLDFDGVDDSLATAAINFTSTDKITTWIGIFRSSSGSSIGMIQELGAGGVVGSYRQSAPEDASAELRLSCYSSGEPNRQYTSLSAPASSSEVVQCSYNLAGATNELCVSSRLNAVDGGSIYGASAGGGNFSNSALNIGRRNNASFPFNGRIYSLIVRGAASTTQEITDTETWVNSKTGAY